MEIDLWWLLTYRARQKVLSRKEIKNNIYYYATSEMNKDVTDLFKATGVEIENEF